MSRIAICLFEQHDLRLVLLAAIVCILACWTTISLGARSVASGRLGWGAAAGLVGGVGVWTTHFVAMLAFHPGIPLAFDISWTALSVVLAVCGGWAAFLTLQLGGRTRAAAGGLVFGLDVAAMHYVGMRAVQDSALMTWDASLVLLSVALGAVLAACAFHLAFRDRRRFDRAWGSALLVLAICSLHFAGMGALALSPLRDGAALGASEVWWLAAALVAAVIVISAFALAALLLDAHLRRRTKREEMRLQTLADVAFEGVLIQQGDAVVDTNSSFLRLVGGGRESVVGRKVSDFLTDEGETAEGDTDAAAAVEGRLRRLDGSLVEVEVLGRAIDYHSKPARVLAFRDISERRASERRIRHLAFHDALTELPNRRLFREALKLALADSQVAVLCLDLDRFKVVNDTLGHQIGDGLLRAAAQRLQHVGRRIDLVARLGGDEFAIIAAQALTAEETTGLCQRIVTRLSEPFEVEGHRLAIGVSIGVALVPQGIDSEEALKRADLALYRAKAEGRNTWRFYEPTMDETMRRRHLLELDLRQALSKGEFHLHYQPLIEIETGQMTGFEALLRWRHPERGTVPPSEFIPLAEEINLIDEIGAWVLRTACIDAAQWPGERTVSVNLSVAQFRSGHLVEKVERSLAESGLPARRLILEVTESLFLGSDAAPLAALHALRALGVKIAMDDFGTGYSSLSYLRRFPFDKLKIDQSFIRDRSTLEQNRAIVRAVIELGHSLGMEVNAEGVETVEQLGMLRTKGCDEAQGYWFSRPIPHADVLRLLDDPATIEQLAFAPEEDAGEARAPLLSPAG